MILLILAILVVSVAVVLVSPTRVCARCHGERITRHHFTGSIIGCPRCQATGRHYRRGATFVHRVRLSIAAERRRIGAEHATATTRPGRKDT